MLIHRNIFIFNGFNFVGAKTDHQATNSNTMPTLWLMQLFKKRFSGCEVATSIFDILLTLGFLIRFIETSMWEFYYRKSPVALQVVF